MHERERVCVRKKVCVCVRERERESVCVCNRECTHALGRAGFEERKCVYYEALERGRDRDRKFAHFQVYVLF